MYKKIEISKYELIPKHTENSKINATLVGLLLRVHFENDLIGYSSLQPWPSLGDFTLDEYLEFIKNKKMKGSLGPAVYLAKKDAIARQKKISLWNENILKFLPKNHKNVSNIFYENFEELYENNFEWIKIKLGLDIEKEIKFLIDSKHRIQNFKLRLDFNFSVPLDHEILLKIFDLNQYFQIDFFEDLILFPKIATDDLLEPRTKKNKWEESGKIIFPQEKLAIDFQKNKTDLKKYGVIVVKPVMELLPKIKNLSKHNHHRRIFTSAMDHPVGQMLGLYEASFFYSEFPNLQETCGFLTHLNFQKNQYSEYLQVKNTKLLPVSGTGIGFDELLKNEKWENLEFTEGNAEK